MLVSCPKCQSRYKLSDEKIRSTGTKVRCPRCQNTFHVFRAAESESPPLSEKPNPLTDPFRKKEPPPTDFTTDDPPDDSELTSPFAHAKTAPSIPPVNEPKETPKVERPRSKQDEPIDDFVESAETIVSSAADRSSAPKKDPSPFKRARISDARMRESDIDQATQMQERESEERGDISELSGSTKERPEAGPIRPFGDATFAEIQVSGRTKGKRKWLALTAGVAAFLSLLAIGLNNFKSHRAGESASTPVASPAATASIEVQKPAAWYRDEPSIFQDYLSQTATLPLVDQQKPETRSLISDALISNGLMTGADDQVISGMGFASGLLAAYPTNVFGFYGLASYGIWKEDLSTLGDLVKRWPEANKSDREFKLAKAIVDGRGGNPKGALESIKKILEAEPQYFRAQAWGLLLSLDYSKEGEAVIGSAKLQDWAKAYEKRRGNLRANGNSPTLYLSIDKRLGKKNLMAQETTKKKENHTEARSKPADEPAPVAKVEKPEPSVDHTAELNQKAAEEFEQRRIETEAAAEKSRAEARHDKDLKAKETTQKALKEKREKQLLAEKEKKLAAEARAKKTLPKADPNLVAMNKQNNRAKASAMNLYEQGNQKQNENKIEEAITLYQAALREDPDLAEVYKKLGVIYMNRKEKERSLRAFKIYLQLKPETQDRQVVEGWISSMQ